MLFEKIALEADEEIITTVRQHWFVITIQLLVIIFFGLVPVFVFMGILTMPSQNVVITFFTTETPIIVFALASWLLLSTMAVATAWTQYYLDLWVLTDRRIIVIDQVSFFNRKVSNFRLERLQDINISISGLIPTLLDYGTIRAQTASESENNFETNFLPDPRGLQSKIQQAMDNRMNKLGDDVVASE